MHGAPHSVAKSDTLLTDNALIHDEVVSLFEEVFGGRAPAAMPTL
jgi:hypothetical protein